MRWLPLVAMVIASALPFPHSPVSRVAVAAPESSSRPAGLAAPPDAVLQENAARVPGSAGGRSSGPGPLTHPDLLPPGRRFRTKERSKASSGPKDASGPHSSRQSPGLVDLPGPDHLLDSAAQRQPGPGSEPRDHRRTADTSGIPSPPGTGPLVSPGLEEQNPDQEAGLGLDGVFDRDEMFLDAHPRVLFSTSPSPPQHPPLLLLLESGLLEEEREDQEPPFEGHGDRAPDRPSSQVPVRRDRRSVLMDRRRGEKSVCESESVWVTNKSTAVDAHGHNVTIMKEIQTQTGPLKQFFYETRCRQAVLRSSDSRSRGPGAAAVGMGVAGASCQGREQPRALALDPHRLLLRLRAAVHGQSGGGAGAPRQDRAGLRGSGGAE